MRWFLLFILLEASLGGFIYQINQTKIQQHLQQQIIMLQTAYTTLVNSYRLTTETLYTETISRPDILSLFAQGMAATTEHEQNLLRGKLYRRLYKTYERLRRQNLRQLHFHTAQGDSYLRMHRPDMYGDNLFDIRESLRIANQEQRSVFGFEAGRVYSGFRYVFPVFDQDQHLGSVEASLPFKAIEEELDRVAPNTRFSLIMYRDTIFRALHSGEKSIYVPSRLHGDYFYEDLGVKELGTPTAQEPLIERLNQKLAKKMEVEQQIQAYKAFASHARYQNKEYAITFVPIRDVAGDKAAYLLSYAPAPLLSTIQQEFYVQLLVLTLMLMILFSFLHRSSKDRKALRQQQLKLTEELQRNKETQQALRESQLEFAGIFNNAPVGIGLLNTDGYYLKANPLFLKLLGYTWEELKPKRCLDINHPDYTEGAQTVIDQLVQGDIEHWNLNKRFIRHDGSLFWGNHWMSALRDENGECVALICIISDLTEQKKAEEELLKLSRVVEQSHNTIVITDLKGTIEFVNPAFTHTSGYSAEEAIGNNPRVLKSGRQNDGFYQSLWGCLSRQETWHGEFYNKRKNGELYWELATISPLYDDNGEVSHYLAIKEDITARKEAELELEQKNEALLRVNQEKNEFLGIAAHDLKNPLSAIRGLAEEIQDEYADLSGEEVVDYAARIRSASQRMFMLITNLLDVNAIESGKLSLNLIPQDVSSILQLTLDDYKLRAEQKNIRLEFYNHVGLCHAKIDVDTLRQVLDNLVSNALKYSPSHTTTQVHLDIQDGHVRMAIQDQGPGLSSEDQQQLFGKFTRLSAQPTAGEHSTGLGLFIVKKLVEAMDGKIYCKSTLHQGATFFVEFAHLQMQKTASPRLNQNLRILLAEDNLFNQKTVQFRLKKLGLHTDIVNNGEEVLAHLERQDYDVIFMDIEMPEMNGLQATQAIRAQAAHQTTPYIIAMTGHSEEEDKQYSLDIGMQGYLVKPFSQEALRLALESVTHLMQQDAD